MDRSFFSNLSLLFQYHNIDIKFFMIKFSKLEYQILICVNLCKLKKSPKCWYKIDNFDPKVQINPTRTLFWHCYDIISWFCCWKKVTSHLWWRAIAFLIYFIFLCATERLYTETNTLIRVNLAIIIMITFIELHI